MLRSRRNSGSRLRLSVADSTRCSRRSAIVCKISTFEIQGAAMITKQGDVDRPPEHRGGAPKGASPAPLCLATEALLRYLFNTLDQADRLRTELHVSACPQCHAHLEGLRLGFEISLEDPGA